MKYESYINELNELEAKGLRRDLFNKSEFTGINFSSNDYLGLSTHPDVIAAAQDAAKEFGTGGTSSRLLAGTNNLHREFEQSIARFLNKEAALLFSSGYHANTGLIPVLAGAGDALFVDHLCHASIIDGVKLSGARFFTFEHNSTAQLEELLNKKRSSYKRAVILTEGVFSMDGDIPPLEKLSALAKQHEALLYVDEAHSFGVYGPEGRGICAQKNVLDGVDVLVGTLSKTLGSQGGFVATAQPLVDLFVSRSRSFIYTTALAPTCVGAGLAALRLLPSLDDRRALVRSTALRLRRELSSLGYSLPSGDSQIVPVWTGDVPATKAVSEHLFRDGFFVPSIRPPTVPVGEGRVRLSITYEIACKGIDPLLMSFQKLNVQAH